MRILNTIGGGGTLEVLTLGDVPQPGLKPHNLDVVIQIDDVHAWHDHLVARGIPIARGIDDPDGLRLWFVQHLKQAE